jgi:Asp-tRNA(Asn)/Glu-tRNA(Gln) amidotransferase A subunit family amidase
MRDLPSMGEPLPLDRRVDRRSFLSRLGALTAAASAGGLEAAWRARPLAAAPGPVVRLPRVSVQETDPAFLTVLEAVTLLRDRALGAVELTEACLSRVRAYDELYRAFNTVTQEAALAAARVADDRGPGLDGLPLLGVPLAVKDNFFTAGILTTANSHIFADFVPDFDAEGWRRLRQAGAGLVGKTQMGPLATSRATTPDGEVTTRNAWAPDNPQVSPGGSSSGSATAVAAGMALGATGTQTGGSITNPSDAQGLTGLKPTMGRVSLRGVIPLTYTRDHPGPIARDARDAGLLLQLMAGPDPADPRTLGQPPLPDLVTAAQTYHGPGGSVRLRWPTRIGVTPDYLDEAPAALPEPLPDATDEERERFRRMLASQTRTAGSVAVRRRMLETFEELGAEIVAVPYPVDWDTLTGGSFNNARLPERAEPFLEHLQRDVRSFGVSLSPWVNGLLLPATEYLRGQRARLLLLERVLETIFSRCDVVVQSRPIPFDIIGLPLISFPIGMRQTEEGPLPVGGLLGGMPWAEDRLLSLAAGFQAVTDWHRRRPPDPGPRGGSGAGDAAGTRRVPPREGAARSVHLDVLDVWEECQ